MAEKRGTHTTLYIVKVIPSEISNVTRTKLSLNFDVQIPISPAAFLGWIFVFPPHPPPSLSRTTYRSYFSLSLRFIYKSADFIQKLETVCLREIKIVFED